MGRKSLAAFAYDELKRRLLVGDFPLGERLSEVRLCTLLGVSRTPIRDALSRLHTEGLLIRLPGGGLSPAAPNLQVITELYEVRRSLEFTALHRPGHDADALRELHDMWCTFEAPTDDEDCSPDFVLHDEEFHIRLAASAGNRSLTDMLRQVNERIRIVRMHDFLTADRVQRTIAEHTEIARMLLEAANGDRRAVAGRLHTHLEISERVVEQRAALALSRMLGGGSHG